jgi:hypothetical protein
MTRAQLIEGYKRIAGLHSLDQLTMVEWVALKRRWEIIEAQQNGKTEHQSTQRTAS